MLKDICELKAIKKEVAVKTDIICDKCGKTIGYITHEYTDNGRLIDRYYFETQRWELSTGHNDWGNDSEDSYEHYDLCSEECCLKMFGEYLKRSGSSRDNSEFFRMEKRFCRLPLRQWLEGEDANDK